jgi:hypothetical protein
VQAIPTSVTQPEISIASARDVQATATPIATSVEETHGQAPSEEIQIAPFQQPVEQPIPMEQQPAEQPTPVTQQPAQPAPLPPFLQEAPATPQPTAAPQPVAPPRAAQPRPLPRLVFSDGQTLALPHHGEVLVGRSDPVSGITPDLDLTPYGGESGGVSRRHAVLQFEQEQWLVVDLDSTNATRVNGQRVTPHTPTPVRDGDTLRFGRVELTFQEQ